PGHAGDPGAVDLVHPHDVRGGEPESTREPPAIGVDRGGVVAHVVGQVERLEIADGRATAAVGHHAADASGAVCCHAGARSVPHERGDVDVVVVIPPTRAGVPGVLTRRGRGGGLVTTLLTPAAAVERCRPEPGGAAGVAGGPL